jgi:hypothetical protein
MCDELLARARHHEQLDTLKQIERLLMSTAYHPPIDDVFQISSTKPYVLDYQERKHVFLWLPSTSLTLSFEDYGTGIVSAQVWVNIGMPVGIRIFAPLVTLGATTPIYIRCTNEGLA